MFTSLESFYNLTVTLAAHRLTRVADTGMRAPVVRAVAVLRTNAGAAGVGNLTALFYPDLLSLVHVDIGQLRGSLAHSHSLGAGWK